MDVPGLWVAVTSQAPTRVKAARDDDRAHFQNNTDDNGSVEVFQLPLRATLSYNSKSLGSCASPLLSIFVRSTTNHANAVTEVAAKAPLRVYKAITS